jgi:glycosyltransferase involved in cell wall biosynthesis
LEQAYFADVVKPMLGNDVELMIEPDEQTRIELLGRAEALINPIVWPEPFGLVMAEALACATPVIASPNGAALEIVEPGSTGFLHQDIDELVEAVGRVGELRRADCRTAAQRRFSMERMAQDHIRLYRRLVDQASMPKIIRWTETRRVHRASVAAL